jgi:hypothetical protein
VSNTPYVEISKPTCPGCARSIDVPDPTWDCYIDGRERAWHRECLRRVASAWLGRPKVVKPEAV